MENKKQTWREDLSREGCDKFSWATHDITYDRATANMKRKYPGNYVVEEFYNSKIHKFDLRLKFDTPADRTMFLLKYE